MNSAMFTAISMIITALALWGFAVPPMINAHNKKVQKGVYMRDLYRVGSFNVEIACSRMGGRLICFTLLSS